MTCVELVLGGGLGYLLTFLALPAFLKLLQEGGATRSNYRGEQIPTGVGFLFIPVYFLTVLLLFKWYGGEPLFFFLLGIVFFACLGIIDDLLGSRSSRGLKGHFGSLLRGKLTTGALKALGGGIGAVLLAVMSFPSRPWWEVLTGALVMALSANTINLFDLRPGRAIKIFFLWFFVLLGAKGSGVSVVLLFPLFGCLLAYAPYDLGAKGMLGDTGANLLGISLGMATAWVLPFATQLVVVGLLVLLHLFTESSSLTKVIEENRILRFLDHLGRSDIK